MRTRGFSAPSPSSVDITSVAARSGSVASINLHSVFGVVTTRTSCTQVGEPASPNSLASAPSSAARTTWIGLVSASSEAPGLTLTGCATRSAQVMTAGISASTSSKPSSLSRSARIVRPSISSFRAPVICAAPISSAISGPTCPVSASSEYLPSMMRSKFSARQPKRERTRRRERIRARERAVFQVHSVIHSHRDRIDQCTARLRRSHRDDRSLGAVTVFQRDRERDSAQVERTDHVGPVAFDRFGRGVEVGFFDQRNLLDANGNLEHGDIPRPDEAS